MPGNWWTQQEDNFLSRSFKAGMDWSAIADQLPGRTVRTCKDRVRLFGFSSLGPCAQFEPTLRVCVSLEAEMDRIARMDARMHRDRTEFSQGIVTSAFFGDPPPGYLDRKRAGA